MNWSVRLLHAPAGRLDKVKLFSMVLLLKRLAQVL